MEDPPSWQQQIEIGIRMDIQDLVLEVRELRLVNAK